MESAFFNKYENTLLQKMCGHKRNCFKSRFDCHIEYAGILTTKTIDFDKLRLTSRLDSLSDLYPTSACSSTWLIVFT